MNSAPNTMGQLRKELAETLHEVRYGHMDIQRGLAVAKIAAQIANLMNSEIEACKFLAEIGKDTQRFGGTPINSVNVKTLSAGSEHLAEAS